MTESAPPSHADALALARTLVATDSRNPTLVPGAPAERPIALVLAATLESWGFAVQIDEFAPARANVVARIGNGTHTLLLVGHLDTVGFEGMTHSPLDASIRNGKLYGRGAADMKGGIAAMCAAAARSAGTARCSIIVAVVADEEYESLGMRALLKSGIRAEAAIVTEPTCLAICPAHRGFVWLTLRFRGRAAHGSRYDLGVDAITHAARFITELDALEHDALHKRTHPLLGRASVHASTIAGGVGFSTYPEECTLRIERRTLPGETVQEVLAEIKAALGRVRERTPELDAQLELATAQPPTEVAGDAPVVQALSRAIAATGAQPRIEGLSAWTDAALLNEAGIPAICFGPGDISLAHAAEEFVPLEEIERATTILERLVRDWGKNDSSP